MWKPIIADADLTRAEAERERADRLYNEALTELDRALFQAPPALAPPPSRDEHQVTPLNKGWTVVPSDPLAGLTGWRRRLAGLTWGLVGPLFQRQQAFNAALVDHINRNGVVHRATRESIETLAGVLSQSLASVERFEARLIAYLQQVTLYVDTKDRDEAAAIRYRLQKVEQRAVGLAAGLSGLGDELRKQLESMTLRGERTASRVAAIEAAPQTRGRPGSVRERLGAIGGRARTPPDRRGRHTGPRASGCSPGSVGFLSERPRRQVRRLRESVSRPARGDPPSTG